MSDPLFELAASTEASLHSAAKAPHDAASTLAWAAFNLRSARVGEHIVAELASGSGGLARLQAVMPEEWDVLEVAAMSLAFEDTMTALDLCANVLYLVSGGTPATQFKDLAYWTPPPAAPSPAAKRVASLPTATQSWISTLLASSDFDDLREARHALTHRTVSRVIRVTFGGGPGRSLAEIATPTRSLGSIDIVIPRLVDFGEKQYELFCKALVIDYGP
jgi:hypothetical protein